MYGTLTETVTKYAATQPLTYAVLTVMGIALFAFAAYGALLLLSRVLRIRWLARQ